MKSYSCTLTMLVFAVFFCVLTFNFDREILSRILELLYQLKILRFYKLILPFLMICAGFIWDILRISNEKKIALAKQRERINIFQITMLTVQDIVGNFLNNLLFFVMEAENSQDFNKETIEELNNLIQKTSEKLNKLANLKTIIEQDNNNVVCLIDIDKSY